MPQPKSFTEKLKEHLGLTSAIIAVVTAIVTTAFGINYHFASAEDLKSVAKNQQEQLQLMRQNSARQLLFQLEYYDNTIKQLEVEKRMQQKMVVPGKRSDAPLRNYDQEIQDAKLKREFTQKQLIEGVK